MDLRKLTYYIQIVESGSYSAAAKVLFVSQPTLSRVVSFLEEELKVKLFHQVGKRIVITDAGRFLYDRAKQIVNEFDNLSSGIKDVNALQKGVIRVGIPPIIGTCVFPQLIAGFKKVYPLIDLIIDQHGAKNIQQKVESGELDIGFTITPFINNSFNSIAICKDKNVVVMHKSHPLAKEDSVNYRSLKEEKFIMLDAEYMLQANILTSSQDAGFSPDVIFHVSHWDFAIQLVKQNLGISILPRPILELYKTDDITYVDLKHESSCWNVYLIQKRETHYGTAVSSFVSWVLNYIDTVNNQI